MSDAKNSLPRKVLGRGLSALIPPAPPPLATPSSGVARIGIEHIAPHPEQPRGHFDETQLGELAQSIRENGVIQPIIVREVKGGAARYQIVAGERRFRAAQRAGLTEIPALIKELSDQDAFAIALIENIQRADLNPIEEAKAYERLLEEHRFTQESLARRVGKERSTITNTLRLLKLPQPVQAMVIGQQLSMGHARALLALESETAMIALAQTLIERQSSVREAEKLIHQLKQTPKPPEVTPEPLPSLDKQALIDQLQSALGTKVRIKESGRKGQGSVEIEYYSLKELDRLLDKLI